MTRSLILSGGGAYADPWHPFAATSERIAAVLEALGHDAGGLHPLLWARHWNNARIVTDLLGHDERSYESPAHRELLTRAARWLTGAQV